MVFQLQPRFKIFIMPNIYSPTKSHMDQTIALPPPQKKNSSTLHHIAILVPHDELVTKSYMHLQLAIVGTHYHNINANIKNKDYWLITSNVGIKIQKALNCSTGLKNTGYFPTFWAVPVCRTVQSENHNLVYTIKFHLMATF